MDQKPQDDQEKTATGEPAGPKKERSPFADLRAVDSVSILGNHNGIMDDELLDELLKSSSKD